MLVALGQATALLVGGFDVSVGALMTMCVVTASFTLTPDDDRPLPGDGVARRHRESGSPPASSTRS